MREQRATKEGNQACPIFRVSFLSFTHAKDTTFRLVNVM